MKSRERIESIVSNLEELYIDAKKAGDTVLAQKLKYASEFILYSVFDDEYTEIAMKPIEFDVLHQDDGLFVFGTPTGYVLPIEIKKPILAHWNSNNMSFPVLTEDPYTSIWEKWNSPSEPAYFKTYDVKLNQYRFQFGGKITTIKIGFNSRSGKWVLAKDRP